MKSKQITGKVLGKLESEIMEIIWHKKKSVSVKSIAEVINKKRKIAYTTVMTIMCRLADKGILKRHLDGQCYLYKPRLTREQFTARAVHAIFSATVSNLGQEVFVHFVKEIQKISPNKRQELLKILNTK